MEKPRSTKCSDTNRGLSIPRTAIFQSRAYTVKKDREFSVPSRDVTTKLSLGGNNDVITELFLPRGSLVSDIPAGDGKLVNLFLLCNISYLCSVIQVNRWKSLQRFAALLTIHLNHVSWKNFSQRQDVHMPCFIYSRHTALSAVSNVSISFSYCLDKMQELYLNWKKVNILNPRSQNFMQRNSMADIQFFSFQNKPVP